MKNTNRKLSLKIMAWTLSITLVMVIGIIYFPKASPGLDFWGALYFTIRLFILEHDLPAFPSHPPLIFIYFFAPAIALSAAGTAISYFLKHSPLLATRWLKGHVLICGVGRTGKLLAETLKQAGVRVVGIDWGDPECFDDWCAEHHVSMIQGSFHSRLVLEKAGAARCRAMIFASGDDLANLEGVVGAYDWMRAPEGRIRLLWAHIANEKLAETARRIFRTEGVLGIRYFDTYRIAATNMIARHFNRDTRRDIKHITILGFGKFGRDLLDVLSRDMRNPKARSFEIIDTRDLTEEVASLAADLDLADRVTFSQACIQTLHLTDSPEKAFFLCTDDDIGNITAAMILARDVNSSHIYVRMAKWPMSAITEHLGSNRGITFFNINSMVVEGIRQLPGIFSAAEKQDLKRRR